MRAFGASSSRARGTRVGTRGLRTMGIQHRLPCLPRLIDRGATSDQIHPRLREKAVFCAPHRRKFVCRCLNTPAVRRVDGDPSRDTFGEVDELVSHTSIRCFAIFTTAPLAWKRQAIARHEFKMHIACNSFSIRPSFLSPFSFLSR